MSPEPSTGSLSRHWRLVSIAGILGTVYFTCVAGAPRTKFLVELHASPFDFGLISGLTSLTLAFQLLAGILADRLRRRKPLWIAVLLLSRVGFAAVLVAPALFTDDRTRIAWITGVLVLTSILGNLSEPLWLSWMSDLLPRDTLNRYWAARQRFVTAGSIAAQVAVAFLFEHFESSGRVLTGFVCIGAVGIAVGVVDILLFTLVPEPPRDAARGVSLRQLLVQPLSDPEFRQFLVFRAGWTFAISVAGPFFYPYLISEFGISVLTLQLLGVVYALGVIASSRPWGMVCDTFGQRPVLQLVVFAKPLVPLTYLILPPVPAIAIPGLVVLFFIDGVTNSGAQLGMQGVVLKTTPRQNRAMYVGAANFVALGLAGGLAPLLSGSLIEPLTRRVACDVGVYHFSGYHIVFVISLLLRFSMYSLASRLRETGSTPFRAVLPYVARPSMLGLLWATHRLQASHHERRRAWAARYLGRLQNPLAIHDLIRALQDPSPLVRTLAADSLGRIGVASASGPLAAALCDPHGRVQSRAARALGRIGGFASLRALLENLHRLDNQALLELVRSLGDIGDDAAILPLIGLFQNEADPGTRLEIATALLQITRANSLDEILQALDAESDRPANPTPGR